MNTLKNTIWWAISDLSHLPEPAHRSDCPGRSPKGTCHAACPVAMMKAVMRNLNAAYNQLVEEK